jgi:hypothetical protein
MIYISQSIPGATVENGMHVLIVILNRGISIHLVAQLAMNTINQEQTINIEE